MAAAPCKCWWKSWTLWVNAIAAALVAFEATAGLLQEYLPVNFYVAMSVALPIINAVLRVVTTTALRFKAEP